MTDMLLLVVTLGTVAIAVVAISTALWGFFLRRLR